jgi:hypothetical protein
VHRLKAPDTVGVMCNLEWVTIEDVELLWAQFVLQAYDAAIALRIESMRDNIQFASETLDVLLWALDDGGYWWCDTCQERHIIEPPGY